MGWMKDIDFGHYISCPFYSYIHCSSTCINNHMRVDPPPSHSSKEKVDSGSRIGLHILYSYCSYKRQKKTWFDVILIALCWFLLIFLGLTIWLFSEYIITLLRDGLESSNVENLVIAFLFARQCCLEGPHVFATYPDWYQVDNNSYVYARSRNKVIN